MRGEVRSNRCIAAAFLHLSIEAKIEQLLGAESHLPQRACGYPRVAQLHSRGAAGRTQLRNRDSTDEQIRNRVSILS